MKRIKPQLLKGMQDAGPALALARRRAIATIEETCRSFGFLPYDTPAMEELSALVGREPSKQQLEAIFHFCNRDDVEVGLRYDLTVPLARMFSQNRLDLPTPFKRYQVGPVWRWDKPEPGRFREFLQFDIDTVGSTQMAADAEIITMIAAIMQNLGITGFYIRVSNRKLLNGLGEFSGAEDDKAKAIYRVIDKLDKFSRERIRLELGPGLKDESGDTITGLGLTEEQIAKVDAFLDLPNSGNVEESLGAVENLLGEIPQVLEATKELRELFANLSGFGLADGVVRFDLHLARGLGYYSGPVFETMLANQPEFGAVFAGGRYDGLVERFLGKGQGVAAVGASVGLDRLLAAQQAQGALNTERTCADVLVTMMDKARLADYAAIATELRDSGIRTDLYTGKGNLGKQMKYADRLGIPLAIVAGSDEFDKGELSIKDLELGRKLADEAETREEWKEQKQQFSIKRGDLVQEIEGQLRKMERRFATRISNEKEEEKRGPASFMRNVTKKSF